MSLSAPVKTYLARLPWFVTHRVALDILDSPLATIDPSRSEKMNLDMLLTGMTRYGSTHWQYQPVGAVNVADVLKGTATRTDCTSLAKIFVEIARELGNAFRDMASQQRPRSASSPSVAPVMVRRGSMPTPPVMPSSPSTVARFEVAMLTPNSYVGEAKEIVKLGHRLVTAKKLADFTGKMGDAELEGRWCFGDHWVAVFRSGLAWDPSFIGYGKPFHADGSDYTGPSADQGWWAREETDTTYHLNRKYTAPGRATVYCFDPADHRGNLAYTFSSWSARKGVGQRMGEFADQFKSNPEMPTFERPKG